MGWMPSLDEQKINDLTNECIVLRTTIARLTAERDEAYERFVFWRDEADKRAAERDEARATAAAAYERAAEALNARGIEEQRNYGLGRETQNFYRARDLVRALATEAETTALAEMLDAETRACAEVAQNVKGGGYSTAYRAILARLDQRKEEGADA